MSEAGADIPYTETLLPLPEGRTLAYDSAGDPNSLALVIFFHGVFGVGDASSLSKTLQAKGVHYVTPTLPGWGSSSARPSGASYVDTLTADITALIHHLYPDTSSHSQLSIYVSGGSYGTVPAQILYGQPFDKFPLGRQIKGLLLLAPLSPPRHDLGFNQGLSWGNWMMVGTPGHVIPGQLIPRLATAAMKPRFSTHEKATKFIRETLFDKMSKEEKVELAEYHKKNGFAEGHLQSKFGLNSWRSVNKTWAGFTEVNDVLWSDWGFVPKEIDAEGLGRHVLVVAAKGDELAPNQQADWITENYRNAELKMIEGGHLAGIYHLDEIWAKFLVDI
ncbi:alpha/beta-hydrolase [Pluteus cervinus]|uniref:Alpha/beta-hydrolase n=1 Tax=Pluteus cervinus TaxID=181527 RepID=A0ACD3B963_9AGAR|nr:alpha/beta-hydrolase [Pluteus cervinus]